jgi:hypothetical protein
MRRNKADSFIEKAKAKHGEVYDYSKFEYSDNKTAGTIVCSLHGEFQKTPVAHVNKGRGCPKCTTGYYPKKTTLEYKQEVALVHDHKYDYSKVEYTGAFGKITITCPEHGDFVQTARDHQRRGCSKCNGGVVYNTKEFIQKAKDAHGEKYNYDKVVYRNRDTEVIIACPEHGEFYQTPRCHLLSVYGCSSCAPNKSLSFDEFVERSTKAHEIQYDYSCVNWENTKTPVEIICHKHGMFEQTPEVHMNGHGCKPCAFERISNNSTNSFEWFMEIANRLHDNRYSYDENSYTNTNGKVDINCSRHGKFTQRVDGHLYANAGCPSCAHIRSKAEDEIKAWIESVYSGEVQQGNREILCPKELDIVLPDIKLAIEYCGLRWHSEVFGGKSKKYHLDKFTKCKERGYTLITIFEDEWLSKRPIVEKVLMNKMQINTKGIGGRKLTIKSIEWQQAKTFLNEYHLQGAGVSGFSRYGAFHGSELMGVMTFSKGRAALNSIGKEIELLRFASNGQTHPGMANRLFKKFLQEHDPSQIVSYSDNRWFTGGTYLHLGFVIDSETTPSYWYIKNPIPKRTHRYQFRKQKVIEMGGDPNLTEWQNMQNMEYDRVWDCGNVKWIWTR